MMSLSGLSRRIVFVQSERESLGFGVSWAVERDGLELNQEQLFNRLFPLAAAVG